MRLTKLGHACFILEDQDRKLIVDPGAFTELPDDLEGVDAVVYTHGHFDHYTPQAHARITSASAGASVYATSDILPEIDGAILPETGKEYMAGPFTLEFYGRHHADKNPPTPNFGVIINGQLAYPGDSLDEAGKPVKTLLAPANGPWMRITETMALIDKTKAPLVIPTHDSLLSKAGNDVADNYLKTSVEKYGGTYQRLDAGESIEI